MMNPHPAPVKVIMSLDFVDYFDATKCIVVGPLRKEIKVKRIELLKSDSS